MKENLNLSIVLNEEITEQQTKAIENYLTKSDFAKSVEYISKEQALKEHIEYLGEDPQAFLGYNPLFAMFEVKLNAAYANNDSEPVIESKLKRFGKTKLLQPGESQILSFKLSAKDLASFYPTFSAWVADQGEYVVRVGASASDIRQKQTFTLPLRLQVEKVGNVLNRNRDFDEIKAKTLP